MCLEGKVMRVELDVLREYLQAYKLFKVCLTYINV